MALNKHIKALRWDSNTWALSLRSDFSPRVTAPYVGVSCQGKVLYRIYLFTLLFMPNLVLAKSVLIDSKHSVPSGQVEMRPLQIQCKNNCYLTTHLVAKKFDETSKWNSSAMYVFASASGNEGIRYGIKLNKKSLIPEIVVEYFYSNKESESFVLSESTLGSWEGFKLSWGNGKYQITLLRQEKHEEYSILRDSGIEHSGNVFFEPETLNYMFIGVDVLQYLDIGEQNVNQEWLKIANSN